MNAGATARLLTVWMLAMPLTALAQSGLSGTIAGSVKDTSGAVMPGVTVEASSPALIEKTRAVTTDDHGEYKIVNLPPGTYTVTFSLVGFGSVKREGIGLTTGFTAPANAELRVGSVAETITVTAASPVVDVQSVRGQNVLSREKLDELPVDKTFQSFAAVTVGASSAGLREVGGSAGETNGGLSIHGAGSGLTAVDGMRVGVTHQNGTPHIYMYNNLAAQEIVLETSGVSTEGEVGSLNVNLVPRDGGNRFTGLFNFDYTNDSMQSKNIDDALRARGVGNQPKTLKVWDVGGGVGGPILKDKLWFFTAHRNWGGTQQYPLFFNATQHSLFYTPDLSRPAYETNRVYDDSVRLKWQVGQHRIAGFYSRQWLCKCYYFVEQNYAPEASNILVFSPNDLKEVTWTWPATNRLLFEGGVAHRNERQLTGRPPETAITDRSMIEASTGFHYGAQFQGPLAAQWLNDQGDHKNAPNFATRLVGNYITGSHAFKFGETTYSGTKPLGGNPTLPDQYTFRNGVPLSITSVASPNYGISKIRINLGIFGQDSWTMKRLTLNYGGRFDYVDAYNPDQTRPAGYYTPEFSFNEVDCVPCWKDFSIRLGAAYDLFGNAKTAIKWSLGRYANPEAMGVAFQFQPGLLIAAITTRTWSDTNGDFIPTCDLKNPALNGECGPMSNQNFGKITPAQAWDPSLLDGKRPYNWQSAVGIQHELRPGFGVSASYFRTWMGNFRVTTNTAVAQSDYTNYCVTAPTDSRLPNGGGNQLCGMADIAPTAFGKSSLLTAPGGNYGSPSQVYNGIDVNMNARFGRGGLLQGGVSTSSTVTNLCYATDPSVVAASGGRNGTLNCKTVVPWLGATQLKLSGVYPLPKGFQVSAVFQNLPGLAYNANMVFTNAQIAPSLGRNLGQCGSAATCNGTVTIPLLVPNANREKRDTQTDLRVARNIQLRHVRIQPRLDLYNLFNANTVLAQNQTFGAAWRTPTSVLPGRMLKIGAQMNF